MPYDPGSEYQPLLQGWKRDNDIVSYQYSDPQFSSEEIRYNYDTLQLNRD